MNFHVTAWVSHIIARQLLQHDVWCIKLEPHHVLHNSKIRLAIEQL